MTSWHEWVRKATNNATQDQIARKLGVSRTTLARRNKKGADVDTVIAIATAYNADPIEGLIAAQKIRPDQINTNTLQHLARRTPTHVLVAELYRRFGVPKQRR